MLLPHYKVKIGPHLWDLYYEETISADGFEGNLGVTLYRPLKMHVCTAAAPSVIVETTIHELLHAARTLFEAEKFDNEEYRVQSMGVIMTQVMKDNRDLMHELMMMLK